MNYVEQTLIAILTLLNGANGVIFRAAVVTREMLSFPNIDSSSSITIAANLKQSGVYAALGKFTARKA